MKTQNVAARALLSGALALALGPAAAPGSAQDRSPKAFRAATDSFIVETLEMMPSVPGLAIAIVQGDSSIYRRGFGWADVEAGKPMTPQTFLYMASNTKSFTALAAGILHARGVVDLDAPLTDYLRRDWFPPELDPSAVTLRHLLTHTSGLSNDPMVFRTAYSGEHTPHDLRALLAQTVRRDDAPLGTFDYTNTGYLMAALVLEEVTGLPWQDLLEREIFGPLGMAATTARRSELPAASFMAAPYRATGGGEWGRIPLEKADDTLHPAGGIISTLPDLERWLLAGMHAGHVPGTDGLPSGVIEATQVVEAPNVGTIGPLGRDGYGLGWIVGSFAGERLIYHIGNFPGAASFVSFMPERELGIVVFVNEDAVGVRVGLMLTAFAYDWWLNEGRSRDQLNGLRSGIVKLLGEARPPASAVTLGESRTRPLVGTYYSDAYGTLYVSRTRRGELALRIGHQHGLAASFENGTASVAFVPGRADSWTFELQDGLAVRVRYGDWGTFERMNTVRNRGSDATNSSEGGSRR